MTALLSTTVLLWQGQVCVHVQYFCYCSVCYHDNTFTDSAPSQIPNLKPHIRWCSCQLQACTILQNKGSNPFFREFEQKCAQDPRTGGLPLSSFLLKPMQRVTKYPLLMKRVRTATT